MQVELPATPVEDHVTVDPRRTALLIIDMQNDFVRPDGKLCVPDAAATVPVIAGLRQRARDAGMHVFYTQDTHPPGDPEFELWGEHALRGSEGWRIVEELAPDEEAGDRVVPTGRYDGFHETELDSELRAAGVDTLLLCGTVANICVLQTAASAGIRWYRLILPIDATSALHPFDLHSTMRQIHFLFQGVVTTAGAIEFEGAGADAIS